MTTYPSLHKIHDAPIYQAHRSLQTLQMQIAWQLKNLFITGSCLDVDLPAIQLFRRDWKTRENASFLWYSYLVEEFNQKHIDRIESFYKETPLAKKTIKSLEDYFTEDSDAKAHIKEIQSIIKTFDTESDNKESNDQELWRQLHHYLLSLYCKVPTQGYLLTPHHTVWKTEYEKEEGVLPIAFLVHLKQESSGEHLKKGSSGLSSLPAYRSWSLGTNQTGWEPIFKGVWTKQENIEILPPRDKIVEDSKILKSIQKAFQDLLYPCFNYKDIPENIEHNPTGFGQKQEKLLGFLILPIFLFTKLPESNGEKNSPASCAGDWHAVLVIHLKKGDSSESTDPDLDNPLLSAGKVFETLESIWPAANLLLQSIIDSEARSSVYSVQKANPHQPIPIEDALKSSFLNSLGWEFKSFNKEALEKPSPIILDEEKYLFKVDLDWEWPNKNEKTGCLLEIGSPSVLSRMPKLGPMRQIVEESVFLHSIRNYRTVYTIYHANRSVFRIKTTPKLENWTKGTENWFGENGPVEHNFIPENKEALKKNIKEIFGDIFDDWYEGERLRLLHGALKKLFGEHSVLRDPERKLTYGSVFIMFLLALYESRSYGNMSEFRKPNIDYNTIIDFGENWENLMISFANQKQAEDFYIRLYCLFIELTVIKKADQRDLNPCVNFNKSNGSIEISIFWSSPVGGGLMKRVQDFTREHCNKFGFSTVRELCITLALLSDRHSHSEKIYILMDRLWLEEDGNRLKVIIGKVIIGPQDPQAASK